MALTPGKKLPPGGQGRPGNAPPRPRKETTARPPSGFSGPKGSAAPHWARARPSKRRNCFRPSSEAGGARAPARSAPNAPPTCRLSPAEAPRPAHRVPTLRPPLPKAWGPQPPPLRPPAPRPAPAAAPGLFPLPSARRLERRTRPRELLVAAPRCKGGAGLGRPRPPAVSRGSRRPRPQGSPFPTPSGGEVLFYCSLCSPFSPCTSSSRTCNNLF